MKIVEIIFTRNEGELLRQNIDFHYKQGVDFFLITDSSSEDNTREVMQGYENMGIAECFYDNGVFLQKEQMDAMAKIAFKKHNPDWIIVSDTDEFWSHRNGLKRFLEQVPYDVNVLKICRYQYFPTANDNVNENVIYHRMRYRENGKWIGFNTGIGENEHSLARAKVAFRPINENIDIMAGNHTVHFPNRVTRKVSKEECIVREFSFRNYEQFKAKVKRAATVFEKNVLYRSHKDYGTHWRTYLEEYQKGRLQEFYKNYIFFNEERLQKALAEGALVKDESLAELDSI
ncbi:MAG: hypothetical protein COT24_01745 [Candidatus Kerfeldbacteria bacterium CG08_land_8_20_14_0_20_40_16]|uniref:Glycosyltransferase family 2 protein n=1 Tax=Candidatus Kerfeldbacteria bacterium CG08_land_8_20_14_0_20_40_16 TaxID=2014244 RepID=A0A2H0YWA3_9BACT|nr:MAG: hypothetical protein COT24_01745 [Candidatus Kerfeldbacteria bacterium CG08_land_8_20_14_0_20_40_16]